MSHFSVLVIGDDIEKQLQPYHEFECTGINDEFVIDIDITDEVKDGFKSNSDYKTEKEYAEELYGINCVFDEKDIDIKGEHKFGYAIVDDNEKVIKAIRRTNPNSKWDWYQIGGRWHGMLKIKDGKNGNLGDPGLFTNGATPGFADQALKGDIDFEFMINEAEKDAIETYDKYEKAVGKIEPPKPWNEFRNDFKDIDLARKAWSDHPWILNIRSANLGLWVRDEVEYYGCGRNAFIERARCKAFSTFAVVKDGKWYEKGEMGWFGMVSGEKDKDDWSEEFMDIINDLPDDTIMTVIDCHI